MVEYDKTRKAYGAGTRKRQPVPAHKKTLRPMGDYHWRFAATVKELLQELEQWDELPTCADKSEVSILFCDEDSQCRPAHGPAGYPMETLAKMLREYLQVARTSFTSQFRTTLEHREQRWKLSVSIKETAHRSKGIWVDAKHRLDPKELEARINLLLKTAEGGD